jgi:ABC-type arginine/histidine transport system permease subunit
VFICDVLVFYTIPSADVDLAWIKSVNKALSGFLNALWLVPVGLTIGFLIALSQEFSNNPI